MTRNLTKLEDAFKAIRELQDEITTLTTTNLDFHRRQIKNAHPSIDDYDYVVRKELKQGLEEKKLDIKGLGSIFKSDYWKGARAILPLVPTVANDVMDNRYRVDIPVGKKVILTGVFATSKIDPSTGDFEADIKRSDNASVSFSSILSPNIKILNGAHRGEILTFAIGELHLDDELRIDVISNGGASGIEIVIDGRLA